MDGLDASGIDGFADIGLEDAVELLLRHNLAVIPELSESTVKDLLRSFPGRTVASLVYLRELGAIGKEIWPNTPDFYKIPAQWAALTGTVGLSNESHINALEGLDASNSDTRRANGVRTDINSLRSTCSSTIWPLKEGRPTLPYELIDMILSYLSRDDLKALRLTCQTLRAQVSDKFFKSIVIPFNAGIYGMLPVPRVSGVEGSPLGTSDSREFESLLLKGKADPDIYSTHGLDVFETFGHHVKKFGMSFAVDEDNLSSIPSKGLFHYKRAYWGEYEWPVPGYQRFTEIASVENAADETLTMKMAFSRLRDIQELGLSIDNGLGWLHGPDISLHSQIFKEPFKVFGKNYTVPDRQTKARLEFWHILKRLSPDTFSAFESATGLLPDLVTRHCQLQISMSSFMALRRNNISRRLCLPNFRSLDISKRAYSAKTTVQSHQLVDTPVAIFMEYPNNPAEYSSDPNLRTGIVTIQDSTSCGTERDYPIKLKPNSLTLPQMEWLLETKWAQQAFISSYIIAIMDNRKTFKTVHTMNLAGISCQYLESLRRNDFWSSLPNLKRVIILVLAEWREIIKDSALCVTSIDQEPLKSCVPLERICHLLAKMESVSVLNIGWASGGEHEKGFYGRNQHLMPAPIMNSAWIQKGMQDLNQLVVPSFPFVEDLTLTNCWVAPTPLLLFMKSHSESLQRITLDSVSLTRQPQNLPLIAEEIPQKFPDSSANSFQHMQQRSQTQPPQPSNQTNHFAAVHGTIRTIIPPMGNAPALSIPPLISPQPLPSHSNVQSSQLRWKNTHEPGSWPWVLEAISPLCPGTEFHSECDYQCITTNLLGPSSVLKSLKLRSCGYAKLSIPNIEQTILTLTAPRSGSVHWSRVRQYAKYMICGGTFEPAYGLGTIAQAIEAKERRTLELAWGCTFGPWQNGSEACAMDGWHKYGTGRFSADIGHD